LELDSLGDKRRAFGGGRLVVGIFLPILDFRFWIAAKKNHLSRQAS
jgi:hypothetical protein